MSPQVLLNLFRQVGFGVRTDGAESVRVSGSEQKPADTESEGLHVPAVKVDRLHPREGHLPPRHQARKRPHFWGLHQTGRFRLVQG